MNEPTVPEVLVVKDKNEDEKPKRKYPANRQTKMSRDANRFADFAVRDAKRPRVSGRVIQREIEARLATGKFHTAVQRCLSQGAPVLLEGHGGLVDLQAAVRFYAYRDIVAQGQSL